jgi:hypothetical protein
VAPKKELGIISWPPSGLKVRGGGKKNMYFPREKNKREVLYLIKRC